MRVPEEQFELIVKYVDADLQESEKESFEELVISSEPFRRELMEVEMIIESIKAIGHQQNVQRVKNIIHKLDAEKSTKKRKSRIIPIRLGIAASITLLTFFSYFISRSSSTGTKSIFKSYYEPYPSVRLFRNEVETSKGMQLYGSQQYKEAIPLLEAERDQQKNDKLLELYIANSYMMTGRYAESEKILKNSKAKTAETLIDQYIYWYLGLTLLQMEKKEEAATVFQKLSVDGGIYEMESKAILESLG